MTPFYHERIPNTSGIYRITCTVTNKFYIGSATNLYQRWNEHRSSLQRNIHGNPKLQNAWNKYGSDAFIFEILEIILIPDLLTMREQYWFDKLKPFGNKGFNIDRVAGSRLGCKASPKTREKLSIARLGNTNSLGKKLSPEVSAKLHAGNIGNTYSLGRRLPPEHIEKIRQSHLGKELSLEHREKLRTAHAENMKILIVTSPDGTEYHVCGVKAFCREHNLNYICLMHVANGKQSQHRGGWIARYPETG